MRTKQLLWPWWVRVSHGLVATAVIALWLMSYGWQETGVWHRTVGYALFALVLVRVLAGLCTRHTPARLNWPGWQAVQGHLRALRCRALPVHHGHSPLGQYAIYALWSLCGLLALTGWLSRTDALWGEDWPVMLHAVFSGCLLALVICHVGAVWLTGLWSGQALIRQMIHGRLHLTRKKVLTPKPAPASKPD